MSDATEVEPNHHASHPGFSGWDGLKAAFRFLSGRDAAAELAIELAAMEAGDRVVDIGCGPGVAVQRARQAGAEVVGVDPASVMIEVARLRWVANRGIAWRIGTAESLPVDDGWADVVWSLATVHHWHDLDAGLAEVGRVLAPGGRFVSVERQIVDPYADGPAGHGWTPAQASLFADMCGERGFGDASVVSRPSDPSDLIAVVVTRQPEVQ